MGDIAQVVVFVVLLTLGGCLGLSWYFIRSIHVRSENAGPNNSSANSRIQQKRCFIGKGQGTKKGKAPRKHPPSQHREKKRVEDDVYPSDLASNTFSYHEIGEFPAFWLSECDHNWLNWMPNLYHGLAGWAVNWFPWSCFLSVRYLSSWRQLLSLKNTIYRWPQLPSNDCENRRVIAFEECPPDSRLMQTKKTFPATSGADHVILSSGAGDVHQRIASTLPVTASHPIYMQATPSTSGEPSNVNSCVSRGGGVEIYGRLIFPALYFGAAALGLFVAYKYTK
ncbi:uncharacterized protein LOC116618731 [Nematostella vectensis]|uniref:uncharacterized protein LOC116618731 n=1 Tax=Nematostella vectensis TaxID=45351 RepID=UPI0020773CA6|nr:uncharacterized protein LOC116618731 [Nematostella vectensis]